MLIHMIIKRVNFLLFTKKLPLRSRKHYDDVNDTDFQPEAKKGFVNTIFTSGKTHLVKNIWRNIRTLFSLPKNFEQTA